MSYTEIYGFDEKGNAFFLGETQNSWRGAMVFWRHLEEKYLHSVERKKHYQENEYNSRFHLMGQPDYEEKMKEFWDLYKDQRLTDAERLVLLSTYDKVIIGKTSINDLIDAYNSIEIESSLKEQAEIIKKATEEDDDIIAVGFNQTSVNGDTWLNYNYTEEDEEAFPYNLYKQKEHLLIGDVPPMVKK